MVASTILSALLPSPKGAFEWGAVFRILRTSAMINIDDQCDTLSSHVDFVKESSFGGEAHA